MSNMVDAYLGEVRIFSGAYAPEGWALCNGSLLDVANNQALFALLGNRWGGNGVNQFAVPDLRGRLPIGQGTGTGLTPRVLTQSGGVEGVALDSSTIPAHSHVFNTLSTPATTGALVASSNTLSYAEGVGGLKTYMDNATASPSEVSFSSASVTSAGSGQAHWNVMPSFVVNYIICTEGIYPDRP